MEKQNIIFDLDDTLSHCNKYFEFAIKSFGKVMLDWFKEYSITKDEIRNKQVEIDLDYVSKFGLTSKHFIYSFTDTYAHFSKLTGRTYCADEAKLLTDLAKGVFEQEFEPYPYTYEILEQLKDEGHNLFLHTGGEESIQQKKITQLELATYFENRVFISLRKDTDALRAIMDEMDFNPEKTWMIGNSLRSDIVPALELGIHAIYIPAETEWRYNVIDVNIEPKGAFITLQSLMEVPKAIRSYIQTNQTNKD